MNIPLSWIERARREAAKADHRFKHAAIIVRGGAIMAIGFNNHGRHAEVSALNKLWPSKRVGCKLISLRFKKDGSLGNAKPCEECYPYILDNGISEIYWS